MVNKESTTATQAASKLVDCKAELSAQKAENMQLKKELEVALKHGRDLERLLKNIHHMHSKVDTYEKTNR